MKILATIGLLLAIWPANGVNNGPHWKFYHIGDTVAALVCGIVLSRKDRP